MGRYMLGQLFHDKTGGRRVGIPLTMWVATRGRHRRRRLIRYGAIVRGIKFEEDVETKDSDRSFWTMHGLPSRPKSVMQLAFGPRRQAVRHKENRVEEV